MNITILHIIFIAPLLGVVAIFLSSKEEKDRIRTISAISTGVALVLSILLLFLYDQSEGGGSVFNPNKRESGFWHQPYFWRRWDQYPHVDSDISCGLGWCLFDVAS